MAISNIDSSVRKTQPREYATGVGFLLGELITFGSALYKSTANFTSTTLENDIYDGYLIKATIDEKGGWKEFLTIAARDAYPVEKMAVGMVAYVAEDDKNYQLKSLSPITWEELMTDETPLPKWVGGVPMNERKAGWIADLT